MILIGQYDSPFVRRVAVALQIYGLRYEHRPWSVWADADKVATVSPLRRVPVLVTDDGDALVESFAILDALDDIAPEGRTLVPRSGKARRDVLRVAALAMGLGDKAVSLLYEHVLRTDVARSEVWVTRCRRQIHDVLDHLERERAAIAFDYWFGALTHADIAVACVYRILTEAHPTLIAEVERPALRAMWERCERLDAFKAVVQPLHVQL